jgi:hypothetical protein
MTDKVEWPKWLYSADDARIFDTAADVPEGDWREVPHGTEHPLDHDGDGKPGGSLPKAKRQYRRKAVK